VVDLEEARKIAMTELEHARTYLRKAQRSLADRRAYRCVRTVIEEAENMVLAALSWVWDAQERAQRSAVEWLQDKMQRNLQEMLSDAPLTYDAEGIQAIQERLQYITINITDPDWDVGFRCPTA
jgi:leucyl aminopeptidase (aminopeptidase T)